MADGKKVFLNKTTGEVIWRRLKISALIYFKVDGKKFGYKVKASDVLDADGILKEFGIVFGKNRRIA